MSNFKQLMETLQASSSIQTAEFTQLRDEWELINVKKDDGWNQCLCGKGIKELCFIKNKLNNNILIVGNECIKKICPGGRFSSETKKLFTAINLLSKKGILNRLLIDYCKDKEIINDWEYEFCLNTHYKNKLTDKQTNTRNKINNKILNILRPKVNS